MAASTSPPPIPGEVIDPPPRPTPKGIRKLEARDSAVGTGVGVGWRAYARFRHSQASLLAAGTAYYLFLAMFALLALGYGLAAAFGAERLSDYLTDALEEAFPGLLGSNGIDPAQLRSVGQTLSLVGALGLLYAGTGAVLAAVRAIHRIYGAPQDGRAFLVARLRSIGWLILLGVLILLSFAMSAVSADVSGEVQKLLGLSGGFDVVVRVSAVLLSLVVNFAVVHLVLSHLGGIRPSRHALRAGAAFGAVVIEVLKAVVTVLIALTVSKPQYGAVAVPIGVLFVLYLQSLTLYSSAALAAGVADRDVPLDVLAERSAAEAQVDLEAALAAAPSGHPEQAVAAAEA
jgi:membrane protein